MPKTPLFRCGLSTAVKAMHRPNKKGFALSFPVGSAGSLLLLAALVTLLEPSPALAYIGPGAGFALGGSLFAVFAAFFSALVLFLTWPIRLVSRMLRFVWRTVLGRGALARSRVQRVVVLGLDGLDHGLTTRLLDEGKLPHLAALRDQGCFKPLGSTLPPISPVAWS